MKFELYHDNSQEWRWRLVADNGRIVADSGEGYKNKIDCESAISLIKRKAITANVQDQESKPG